MKFFEGFNTLFQAISNKKKELLISMQLVIILTMLIAVLLYWVEKESNGGNFTSYLATLSWCFSKFVNDIGGYGDFQPITLMGKILATIVGLLSIVIFALPAGIISSGFVEELEKKKEEEKLKANSNLLNAAFDFEVMAVTKKVKKKYEMNDIYRKYMTVNGITANLLIPEVEIFETIRNGEGFRLRNHDEFIVEKFITNSSYGTYFNNQSKITIINTIGRLNLFISHYTYALHKKLNSNYLSVEKYASTSIDPKLNFNFAKADYFSNENDIPALTDFKNDIKTVVDKKSCVFNFLAADLKRKDGTEAHFQIIPATFVGSAKNNEDNVTIFDLKMFNEFYDELSSILLDKFQFKVIKNDYNGNFAKTHLHNHLWNELNANVLTIYIAKDLLETKTMDLYYGSIYCLSETIKKYYC